MTSNNNMDKMKLFFTGLPSDLPDVDLALFRSRVLFACEELAKKSSEPLPVIAVGEAQQIKDFNRALSMCHKSADIPLPDTSDFHNLIRQPAYSFEQLVLPENVLYELQLSIQLLQVESLVFETWGLRKIEPNPRSALNFYGPPGTGKTMAAHALAARSGKKILVASYAEIESKFHGDGPKNVKKLFNAAEQENALLFIDEADSLLSKRLTNVTQGSEQAINSMRSQLLINLEQFKGIVIFATNLAENYDKAFESRIHHIKFSLPDEKAREKIWKMHLLDTLPLTDDVSCKKLAVEFDNICGRDIKNAVIMAAVEAAVHKKNISHKMLVKHIEKIKNSQIAQPTSIRERECSPAEKKKLEQRIKKAIKNNRKK